MFYRIGCPSEVAERVLLAVVLKLNGVVLIDSAVGCCVVKV